MGKNIQERKAYRYITIIHEKQKKIITECHIYSSYIYRKRHGGSGS